MTTRRQVQTPGKAADPVEQPQEVEQVATEAAAETESPKTDNLDPENPAETVEQSDEPSLGGGVLDPALILPEILETVRRIEEQLLNGSPSTQVKAKPKKQRFKYVEGKGHILVEE
ncbi:hypothetical protein AWW72_13280 [Acinetobacter sp. NRRL B-65365]|uniref:hypothetical protein n=1 Tax=Acinetobacter sp. NRRL B-65365 TaxID=1785092 RepID=UPI0007A0CCD6|nr:hypothetical protein [Acinetobacter sp. NRRL B-65365]KYQ83555.1 hypothetical protein AWW72_13280 [Acinetobacter sp. NRRL B-65365]